MSSTPQATAEPQPPNPNHLGVEEVQRREAFSGQLQAFLRSNQYLNQVNIIPDDEGSLPYIQAQLMSLLETATHPDYSHAIRSIESIAGHVENMARPPSDNTTLSRLFRAAAALAPAVRQWASQRRRDLDSDQAEARITQSLEEQETRDRETRALCDRITDDLRNNNGLDNEACERAIRVLQLLLFTTSITVSETVRKISRENKAKIFGWSAGAAFGVMVAGAFLFTPVIPVVATGAALYGPIVGCSIGTIASTTASGVAIKTVRASRKELSKCPTIRLKFQSIHQNIKALVGFFGYLYQMQASLSYRNNNVYVELINRLDASLSGDMARWTAPGYIEQYISEASQSLGDGLDDLRNYMGTIGFAIDPLSVP